MTYKPYISDRVIKQLYALSGNECANPLCHNKLVYPDNKTNDIQICHIEAASPDGPRYNPNQTYDERRDFDNLILLCHKCHYMIDKNPDIYTVEVLKKWKQEQVAKYKPNSKEKVFHFSVPDGLLARDTETDNLFEGVINNRLFNLIGVGGSGKKSLTYLMIQKHKDDFNEIAYVVVNNNIKEDIVSTVNIFSKIEFGKDDNTYQKIVTYLEDNFKATKPNLLVLDIDKTFYDEANKQCVKELETILSDWKILILSREQFRGYATYNLNDIKDMAFLKELFLEKAGKAKYQNFTQFDELFKILHYSPILAEQLGSHLQELPIQSLDEIKAIFLDDSFRKEEVENRNVTLIRFLIELIDFKRFNTNEQELLQHFVLWQTDYIDYNIIKKLLKGVFATDADLNSAIVSLSKRAILTSDKNKSYKLHGLLAESLREQIYISKQDYTAYLNNIEELIIKDNLSYSEATDCIANSLLNNNIIDISNFFEKIVSKFQTKQSTKDTSVPNIALASILNNIALLYDRKGNKKIANDYYQKAINVYKQPNKNPQPKTDKNKENGIELIKKIKDCPKGQNGWSPFEKIGSEVFTYLFANSFRNYTFKLQPTTNDGNFRRDMLVYNTFKESTSFWQRVQHNYNANLIIIDFKNYTKPLNHDQFYNPSKYMNKASGHFAIIMARCGLDESATDHQQKLLDENKLIMCLSDNDLIKLINKKMEGQDPLWTLEEMYYSLIAKH